METSEMLIFSIMAGDYELFKIEAKTWADAKNRYPDFEVVNVF